MLAKMGNGIYCEVETYTCELAPDERLFRDSREKLNYLKGTQRRLLLLAKQLAHYGRNPLGGAMCKEIEARMYQQMLLASRNHIELSAMVDTYNRMLEDSEATASGPQSQQSSSLADWEEVVEMAKMPVESVPTRSPARSSSSYETPFKSIYMVPKATAPADDADSRRSHKTFPQQMTPPIEEIVELRESLKLIEQSPLFTTTPTFKAAKAPALGAGVAGVAGLRLPKSLP
ncbi:hypothetical protein IWW37_000876 [Coemansia sp. RSA 2050]|nr:hypothetical protein IWW37_000876 [Coemansia sp. RSA 2050]KAJ2733093.1 hypothetical protein IW152_003329 [Coemansia sp. BCRC 34962]